MKRRLQDIEYNLKHKKAYLQVEKELTQHYSLRGILHDVDKLFLIVLLPKKYVSKVHRFWSRHHNESFWKKKYYRGMVIDWECSHLTKKEKQMRSHETLLTIYPSLYDDILPIIKEYGLYKENIHEKYLRIKLDKI